MMNLPLVFSHYSKHPPYRVLGPGIYAYEVIAIVREKNIWLYGSNPNVGITNQFAIRLSK